MFSGLKVFTYISLFKTNCTIDTTMGNLPLCNKLIDFGRRHTEPFGYVRDS